jgi:hypothetical protein
VPDHTPAVGDPGRRNPHRFSGPPIFRKAGVGDGAQKAKGSGSGN